MQNSNIVIYENNENNIVYQTRYIYKGQHGIITKIKWKRDHIARKYISCLTNGLRAILSIESVPITDHTAGSISDFDAVYSMCNM